MPIKFGPAGLGAVKEAISNNVILYGVEQYYELIK